jgi:hypothetical protein
MIDIDTKKAHMDSGAVRRLMMQARQARSNAMRHGAGVFFRTIARGAAFLVASLRSVFAMPRSSPTGLLACFAPISNSVSKGGIQ